MDAWFLITATLCICALLKNLFTNVIQSRKSNHKLPPGPPPIPFLGNPIMLFKIFIELEHVILDMHAKYGPIITLYTGSKPFIFINSRSLAHQALVQNGILYADRPDPPTTNIMSVASAFYGPTWRVLRRNLASISLHPARVRSYSKARKWVLDILIDSVTCRSESGEPIRVHEPVRYAMFCLLTLMCYGDKLDEVEIKKIEDFHNRLISSVRSFSVLNAWPRLGYVLFLSRWRDFLKLRMDREEVLAPLIRTRKKMKEEIMSKVNEEEPINSYVDALLDLELPDEKRKLTEDEIVASCSEFLIAGTDTTTTALQWIMANLVKYQHIQEKVYNEIKEVVGEGNEVKEEDLQKLKYLNAVIMEGLRLHPPGHFVLPHAVREDTVLAGYSIPKDAVINFMIAEIGRDAEAWDDPKAFRPERFMDSLDAEATDITGSKGIKMMPFGVGRRICPGMNLAMHHLEYFVANLVWHFMWKPVGQDGVDLTEKVEFTVVMKNPLQTYACPRLRS